MSREAFKKLIVRYANGREICNCREAYYTRCGTGYDSKRGNVTDLPACQYGCSANLIKAKEYVAAKVIEEFKI